jgi:hypothetical protein
VPRAAQYARAAPTCKGCSDSRGGLIQADHKARLDALQCELDLVYKENEALVDTFIGRLDRPMSPEEHRTFLRARAGLEVPPGNVLNLRPVTADTLLNTSRPYRAPRYTLHGIPLSMLNFNA